MPVYLLSDRIAFPPPTDADPSGLLAVGGDLSPERLLLAYSMGIFPWYSEAEPILWFSPDPRMVLEPARVHASRSLERRLRREDFRVTMDGSFQQVIRACAEVPRDDQDGTWITEDMVTAYEQLHEMGFAHSVEVWSGDSLVGGLYGLSLGSCFCGESMFSREPDASKVALVRLARQLDIWGFDLIDCQLPTEHLQRFGSEPWPRDRFLAALADSVQKPTRRGVWKLDDDG